MNGPLDRCWMNMSMLGYKIYYNLRERSDTRDCTPGSSKLTYRWLGSSRSGVGVEDSRNSTANRMLGESSVRSRSTARSWSRSSCWRIYSPRAEGLPDALPSSLFQRSVNTSTTELKTYNLCSITVVVLNKSCQPFEYSMLVHFMISNR
jgi:hypothetical protein